MKIKKSVVRVRVRRGIQFLNARVSGWHTKIDLRKLNMDAITECIGGQVSGSYGQFLAEYLISGSRAVAYGFMVPQSIPSNDRFDRYCESLTQCWREEIKKLDATRV